MGLLTQVVSQDVATRCCLHGNRKKCQYTQPLVGRTGLALGSHNIKP
ncbi:hypothetical protein F383_36026 [Gossypium arboreum]|uniref:Uncharacterized protein n=1 Tax=Gossypium arboreum TaxID=29729 RepID=A0A0B0N877_GOSAR|nr:hypothetical protein F383_36026 [Gossypium arboreum]